jgi:hypothetical protein
VQVLGWYAWRRAEIENYLLEPEVLFPVMAEAFGCKEEQVREAVGEILPALVAFQATQYALYRARRTWVESDPVQILPQMAQNVSFRPRWTGGQPRLAAPDVDSVRKQLKDNVERWQACFLSKEDCAIQGSQGKALLPDFEAKCSEWGRVDFGDQVWRMDWAGKEILHWLRIWLTGTFGWRDATGARALVKWDGLGRAKMAAQDRPIEDVLRPFLCQKFLDHLGTLKEGSILSEWQNIETALRTVVP